MTRWTIPLGLLFAFVANQAVETSFGAEPVLGRDVVLNADSTTYDTHPAAVLLADGTVRLVWHGYHQSRDRVIASAVLPDGTVEKPQILSDRHAVQGPPAIASDGRDAWVAWSTRRDGRWQIQVRKLSQGIWQPPEIISPDGCDCVHPAVAIVDGRPLVVFSGLGDRRFQIQARHMTVQGWSPVLALSSAGFDAFRPRLVVAGSGRTWVLWDEYDLERYCVRGQQVWPKLGGSERVSPPGEHCLTPTVTAFADGICAAWLRKVDVIGPPGVVSQLHTLHAAVCSDTEWQPVLSKWRPVTDSQGSATAAELTSGLMAKIDPEPIATGGYLGRRTQPMLAVSGGDLWLLWERKSDHSGRSPDVVGELIGRRLDGGQWAAPLVLHRGLVDYHVGPAVSTDGRLTMIASNLPRNTRRVYHLLSIDPAAGEPFVQESWEGWKPEKLPTAEERVDRHQITLDGRTYKLYWADLHCHSGLTGDAEGEPDELNVYARDRALLDAVAFTENDFLYDVPLTEYEYAFGNLLARAFSRHRAFISLPAYEWTSRIPGVASAALDDPGNWTPPYRNQSYANHRSVLYPNSSGPLLRYPEVGNDISVLNEAVAGGGGVTITQHEVFKVTGHPVEIGLELTTGWRNYIERRPAHFHGPLADGLRFGFAACGDSHRRAPGLSGALTGVYAERLTVDALFEALRARRFYATNGSRIVLDARADGRLMGEELTAPDRSVRLTLAVAATRPIVSAVLIRNGVERYTATVEHRSRELSAEYFDDDLPAGRHWYYWRVTQEGQSPSLPGNLMVARGNAAWSSPSFVVVP